MTEQEKREKAIEEMAQMGSIVCKGCDCTKCANCVHYNRAKELYYAGYRKEEEVQKETAKNIFERLEKFICAAIDDELLENYVRGLFVSERKHFCVEVEE